MFPSDKRAPLVPFLNINYSPPDHKWQCTFFLTEPRRCIPSHDDTLRPRPCSLSLSLPRIFPKARGVCKCSAWIHGLAGQPDFAVIGGQCNDRGWGQCCCCLADAVITAAQHILQVSGHLSIPNNAKETIVCGEGREIRGRVVPALNKSASPSFLGNTLIMWKERRERKRERERKTHRQTDRELWRDQMMPSFACQIGVGEVSSIYLFWL
ncbi:hypothetical protein B0O99DRAFT_124023 [Bisporella sp. PMI_857]|nr:hypothetical protein B0O99DRAFT_124023 [Bisporella sp. PMI_857]